MSLKYDDLLLASITRLSHTLIHMFQIKLKLIDLMLLFLLMLIYFYDLMGYILLTVMYKTSKWVQSSEAYSKPCQTFKMEHFAKRVNS